MKPHISFVSTVVASLLLITFAASAENSSNTLDLQKLLKDKKCIGCDLSNVNVTNTNLSGADLAGANLTGANLSGANLTGADLTDIILNKSKRFESNKRQVNFTNANLTGANLTGANLTGVNLTGANLTAANLTGANLAGAIFNKSKYIKNNYPDTLIHNCSKFKAAELTRANLKDANLKNAHLECASLTSANLEGANLEDTTLTSANLEGAKLINAGLKNAKFIYADLKDIDLRGEHLSGVSIPYLTYLNKAAEENEEALRSLKRQNIDTRLFFTKLMQELPEFFQNPKNIFKAQPIRYKKNNLCLPKNLLEENIPNTISFEGANLYGANLSGSYMAGDNLSNANLVNAKLQNATLFCSNLYGGNLVEANLNGADLSFANLNEANLTNVKLDTAHLDQAEQHYYRYAFWQKLDSADNFALKKILEILADPDFNGVFETFKILLAPITILIGVYTFLRKLTSERHSYLNKKFKEFEEKTEVINVRKMLNSELKFIKLFPSNSPAFRSIPVTDQMLAEALEEETEVKLKTAYENYRQKLEKDSSLIKLDEADEEVFNHAAIRDNFDVFLDYLQQFEIMIESHVIAASVFENYISPWIKIIKKNSTSKKIHVLKYMGLLNSIEYHELSSAQKSVRKLFERYCLLEDLVSPMQVESIAPFLVTNSSEEKCNWALWFKAHYQYERYKKPGSNNISNEDYNEIYEYQQLLESRKKAYILDGYKVFCGNENYFELNIISRSNLLSLILTQVDLRRSLFEISLLRFCSLFFDNFLLPIPFMVQLINKLIRENNPNQYLIKIAGQPDIIAISKDPNKPSYVEVCKISDKNISKDENKKIIRAYALFLSLTQGIKPLIFSKKISTEIKLPRGISFKSRVSYVGSPILIDEVYSMESELYKSCTTLFSQLNKNKKGRQPNKENCEMCDISKIHCQERFEGESEKLTTLNRRTTQP
ncbi:MAG: pentapeptide repeat-containing protein [Chroococcidiopsidaceae cyanobacterium CP_BM_RX_35]|nr:pentapeptide repeat-containing protein [Chroococcidiopsidaceae cyanobacterium CP_BM_RX_35]